MEDPIVRSAMSLAQLCLELGFPIPTDTAATLMKAGIIVKDIEGKR